VGTEEEDGMIPDPRIQVRFNPMVLRRMASIMREAVPIVREELPGVPEEILYQLTHMLVANALEVVQSAPPPQLRERVGFG
jgi:hypothetical protein